MKKKCYVMQFYWSLFLMKHYKVSDIKKYGELNHVKQLTLSLSEFSDDDPK